MVEVSSRSSLQHKHLRNAPRIRRIEQPKGHLRTGFKNFCDICRDESQQGDVTGNLLN